MGKLDNRRTPVRGKLGCCNGCREMRHLFLFNVRGFWRQLCRGCISFCVEEAFKKVTEARGGWYAEVYRREKKLNAENKRKWQDIAEAVGAMAREMDRPKPRLQLVSRGTDY